MISVLHLSPFGVSRCCLEGVVQAHQERKADIIKKHIPLHQGVLHLVSCKDGFLLKHIDGIIFPGGNSFHQVHLARERERMLNNRGS